MQTAVKNLGVGLGFRRDFSKELLQTLPQEIDWLEIHPENFIDRGGPLARDFALARQHYPFSGHGLTLSFGNTDPLPWDYLKKLKQFLRNHAMTWYADHLCFSAFGQAHLHDLLPIPLTLAVAKHVAERVRIVQDVLEVPVGMENTSYYLHVAPPEMSELEFVMEILQRSGAFLLCDVNNLYVNQLNHGASAVDFIQQIDVSRIIQIHVAGHVRRAEDLVIDTHGESVCAEVWDLLRALGKRMPLCNVLLERDANVPGLSALLEEIKVVREIYAQSQNRFLGKAS